DVVALAVRDRHADHLARIVAARERRVGALHPQADLVTNELERGIAHQHAWQQPGLAKNLEAVADAEHEAATLGMFAHGIHHRRARRDRAATQIIAVGEAARDDDEIGALRQLMLRVPYHRGLAAGDEPQRAGHVTLAIDAGEDEDR